MKVFKDEQLNQKYLEEGYVKIKLVTNDDCVQIKKRAIKLLADKGDNKLNFSILPNPSSTDEECLLIHDFFKNLLNQKIAKIITDDFTFFSSSFLIKKPRSSSLRWHIDPSFYNNKKFITPVSIWAGIDKTTSKNGCLRVVPKSHKLAFDYESFPLGELGVAALERNENIKKLIEKHAINIPLEEGEVIIHNQALFHGSNPNNSYFKKRIAYKILLFPKNVEKLELVCFNKTNNNLNIYEMAKSKVSVNIPRHYNNTTTFNPLLNEDNLIKNIVLNLNNLPYTTLTEMEKIMNTPNDSFKAKFELF